MQVVHGFLSEIVPNDAFNRGLWSVCSSVREGLGGDPVHLGLVDVDNACVIDLSEGPVSLDTVSDG